MTPGTIDVALSEEIVDLRWSPLTTIMLFVSLWWVKNVLYVAAAAAVDVAQRRAPWRPAAIAAAALLAAFLANALKSVFDRPRPYAQGLWPALGTPPLSGSMPSGHATTAAAAATAVALLYPELRLPAIVLAALICLSRVYLGVHFVSDVVVGALLGAAIGASVALLCRKLPSRTPAA